MNFSKGWRLALFAIALLLVTGMGLYRLWPVLRTQLFPSASQEERDVSPAISFDRAPLLRDLKAAGFALGDAAFVRIFKRESRLELWLADGQSFRLFRTYPICTFSGGLGPKHSEGDRQAPEGFYKVAKAQLNPNSRHHLSFNLGFPNAFDRQLGRTGSALMVHGGCSSIGCYAMTDEKVDEIYAVVEAAILGGQREVDVHIFPFEPTEAALASFAGHEAAVFWANIKQGFDLFEASHIPPKVAACRGEYRFGNDAEGEDCQMIRGWI